MKTRILSLIVYRLLTVSLLMIYQLLAVLAGLPILPFQGVLVATIGVSVCSASYLFYFFYNPQSKKDFYSFVFIQFLMDLMIISVMVFFSGSELTSLRFLYLMIIVLSAIFLDKMSIYIIMILSLAFYYMSLGGMSFFWSNTNANLSQIASINHPALISQTLFALLTGLLSGFLQTTYRSSRAALRIQEQRVNSLRVIRKKIVESLPSGLLTCGSDGMVDYVNATGQEILDEQVKYLENHTIWNLLKVDTPKKNRDFAPIRRETQILVNGIVKDLGITYRPLEMESGQGGYMVVFQDLTKIKKLEAHGRLAEKMAAIGKVAAGVAHEIRNPLAAISGSIQVLKEVIPEEPTAKELAEIVAKETHRLNDIISQFLAYARPGAPPEFLPIDLVSCLKDFIQLTDHDPQMKDLTIETDFNEEPCIMLGDESKLVQVFWNLLRNSYNACKNKPEIFISCKGENETIVFELRDNGVGMTEEQLSDLFTPFQSFSKSGLGLGMSIVYDVIRMHHGKIDVRSEISKGTSVVLYFNKYRA